MTRLYVLTEDVDNPLRDKRCRYGFEAVRTFKAGYKFAYDADNPTYDDGLPRDARDLSGKFIPFLIFNRLWPRSVGVEPESYREYKATTRAAGLAIDDDVLEMLWSDPRLQDVVRAALAAVMQRLETDQVVPG